MESWSGEVIGERISEWVKEHAYNLFSIAQTYIYLKQLSFRTTLLDAQLSVLVRKLTI